MKREVNAVLIRQFSGPTRANIAEMNVYGFKNVAYGLTPVTEGGYDVYPIGESYLYGRGDERRRRRILRGRQNMDGVLGRSGRFRGCSGCLCAREVRLAD